MVTTVIVLDFWQWIVSFDYIHACMSKFFLFIFVARINDKYFNFSIYSTVCVTICCTQWMCAIIDLKLFERKGVNIIASTCIHWTSGGSAPRHSPEVHKFKIFLGENPQTPFMLLLFSSARASIQTQIRHCTEHVGNWDYRSLALSKYTSHLMWHHFSATSLTPSYWAVCRAMCSHHGEGNAWEVMPHQWMCTTEEVIVIIITCSVQWRIWVWIDARAELKSRSIKGVWGFSPRKILNLCTSGECLGADPPLVQCIHVLAIMFTPFLSNNFKSIIAHIHCVQQIVTHTVL